MKLAFVNDAYEKMGVEYLSSVLKKHDHQVRLFIDPQLFYDENMKSEWLNNIFSYKKPLIDNLLNYNPDIVGFSVISDFYPWACDLAKIIKKRNPKIPIVFGGIHPTSVPEFVIQNDFVDMICIGEGEYALLELVESLKKGKIDYNIKNIWFKKEGNIIKNPLRPLLQHLDELPLPDKQLFYEESSHFKQTYFISTSRGCLYSCSYCCNSFLRELYSNDKGNFMRKRSVDNVINELSLNKRRYNINLVRFHDDIFSVDRAWLREFSSIYKKEIGAPFSCYVHPNTVDEEVACLMKNAGCYEAEIGIQTMHKQTREQILERFTNDSKIEEVINILKALKMKVTVNNIFGIPGQTIEEILDLARFYNKNRVTRLYFYGLRYYPKTKIVTIAKDKKVLTDKDILSIEKGEEYLTFVRGGHLMGSKELNKLRTFFTMLPFLPRSVNNFIIEKRIYRFFPTFPYFILVVFSNWIRIRYKYNWMLRRTLKRYIIFIARKIFRF